MTDQPTPQLDRLDNGLRVVSQAMPHLRTASVGIWIDAGARHERQEVNGVAHMLEHMAFKGTRRRSAQRIAEEIEDVGGHLNAYTSREHTAYYARVLADDLPLGFDMLGDIVRHSTMVEEELARERTVILQEIGQVQDTPDDLVFDLFQETAYPDQPIGRSILGPAGTVAAMPRDDLFAFMAEHYHPERMVIAAAGKIEHQRLLDMADDMFGDLAPAAGLALEGARYQGGALRLPRDLEQAHIILGYPAFAYTDPDYYALQVFATLLGGGMSSRLFQEVRERRGLAYTVYSFVQSYADTGLLGIYAGTGEDDTAELLPVVIDETARLAETVTEAELARAKAQLKASLLMSLESCSALTEDLARQLLSFGEIMPPDTWIGKIGAVDGSDLRRVAARILDQAQRPTLTAIGPIRHLPELG